MNRDCHLGALIGKKKCDIWVGHGEGRGGSAGRKERERERESEVSGWGDLGFSGMAGCSACACFGRLCAYL